MLQGSSADDSIRGDEDNDQLTGADGNDKLVGGDDADVIQGGFGGDFLFGGSGNDELYSGAGDDILFGSKGADYFDCGEGYDTIIDFAPTKGDTNSDNCEVVLTHGSKNTEINCDSSSDGKFQSKIKSEEGVNNSMISSSTISVPNPLDMLCDDEGYMKPCKRGQSNLESEQKSNYYFLILWLLKSRKNARIIRPTNLINNS